MGCPLYVLTEPRCPVHGQMSLRLGCDPSPDSAAIAEAYVCHGYDGEGCRHTASGSEWVHIGETAGPVRISFEPEWTW